MENFIPKSDCFQYLCVKTEGNGILLCIFSTSACYSDGSFPQVFPAGVRCRHRRIKLTSIDLYSKATSYNICVLEWRITWMLRLRAEFRAIKSSRLIGLMHWQCFIPIVSNPVAMGGSSESAQVGSQVSAAYNTVWNWMVFYRCSTCHKQGGDPLFVTSRPDLWQVCV